jgi:hypothetical protein
MRAHHWLAVALFLLLLVLISSITFADGVTISAEPQEPGGSIVLPMAPGETTATLSLYLRNTTTATLENLDLFAYLEDDRGQALPGVGLNFLDPTNDQPLEGFALAAESRRPVHLQVENLAAFGTFTGTISLQQTVSPTTETTFQVLANFRLDKPGQPKIAVQGADAEGNISHTASTSETDLHLELLEENGQVGVDDLVVSLSPAPGRSDGAPGRPAAALTWPSEGVTVTEGPLSLPAHGRRTLTLHATLPEVTTYRGTLDLQYGDQLERYTLLITRAAPGAVTARPAQDDGTVALVVRSASFSRTVTLELPQGQPAVQDLLISLVGLRREDGGSMAKDAALDCSLCDGQAHTLEAARPLEITLTGRGLETGTYLAGLLLSHANGPQTIPLRITRSALAANLELAQPETGDGMTWLWFGGATVDVKAVVTEKEGRATQIDYPTIELVSRQDQKGRTVSVISETYQLYRQEDSGELVSVSSTEALETVDLLAQQQATFVYRYNLDKAGTYSGKIRVLGPDSTAVEKTFTITVKDAWLYAFLTILLGVTLSFLLRWWRRAGRVRNLRAARIAELEIVIQGLREEAPEDPVWIYLSNELRKLQMKNRIEEAVTDADVNTALERLGKRQEIYQDALAAREQIGRLLQSYPAEGDLAKNKHDYEKQAQDLFETIQRQLRQEDDAGLGNNEAPATRDSLQDKRNEIEIATVKDPAVQLQAQVKALVAEVEADRLSDDLKAKANILKAEVDKIVTDVDAKGADIKALAKKLNARIGEYADLRLDQLDELLRRLDAQQDAASQVTNWGLVDERQATARKHYDRARNQATAAGKLDEWEQGRHYYLGAAIEFLSILIAQPPPGIVPDEWKLLLAGVPDLQPNLKEAEAAWKLASPEAEEAHRLAEEAYGRAREEYLKLLVEVLRKRIAATHKLVGSMPGFVEPTEWPEILEGSLAPRLIELDKAKDALPTADAKPDERRTKYQDARQKYLSAQVQALEAGHAAMNKYYEEHKTEGNHPQANLWTTTIPAELAKMAATIAAAKAKQEEFNAGETEEALLEAEKAARDAEGQYADSLEACAATGARAFGPAAAAPIALVLGLASAAASIPAALAGGLSVPSKEAFEESKRRAYRPKPPGHYFRRILRNDFIAALIALTIASISGLLALWVGQAAFGGVLYISAFLWGFGFSEATTAAADVLTQLGVEKS